MGVDDLFERHHFDSEVVRLCVRWYLCSELSLREVVSRMAGRGLPVAHTTLMRWTRRCAGSGRQSTNGSASRSWRVEEARIKVRGKRRYLYRAVDVSSGETVDFRFADRPDIAVAEAFLVKGDDT